MMANAFPNLPEEEKIEIVNAALAGGINWFDTAELYGNGRSEEVLSSALKALGKQDDEVAIATKWSPIFRTARNIPKTIEDRIHFLDGYTIDVYMVHQPMSFSSPEAEMDAMADLVEAGKIRSVGVSNFNADRMRRAHSALKKRGLPLAVNQMQYSLLNRKIETNGVLEAAKELGVTIIAYTPLGNGILTGKYHKNPELLGQKSRLRQRLMKGKFESGGRVVKALGETAETHGVLPGQVALNWLVTTQGETVVAIPGATKVSHAEESAGAMGFRLTEDEIAKLDEVSREFRN
jgi:aryl-alcohol dehydrogenase-like predicted oxidoreductase